MIGQSHLIGMTVVVEQRLAEFHAEAAHHRLGRLAQQGANRHQVWPDLAAVAVVLALLLAANYAVGAA